MRSGGGRQGLELAPEALVTMSALQAALPGLSDKYVFENDMIRLVQAVGWGWCRVAAAEG